MATAIFAVCMSAIYASFRTASRSFEAGRRSAEVVQALRFTADQITRDLRTAYFETDYDRRRLELAKQMNATENRILDALKDGESIGFGSEESSDDPSFLGLQLNLRFTGKAAGDSSTVEFAHSLPSDGTFDNSFMGAERVRYFLGGPEGTSLYRQRSRVVSYLRLNPDLEKEIERAQDEREAKKAERREKPLYYVTGGRGAVSRRKVQISPDVVVPRPDDPLMDVNYVISVPEESFPPELLAENVVEFKLAYGYYFGQWLEADDWDSEARRHRTPPFNVPEGELEYLSKLMAYRNRPNDLLPSYVRLRLAIRDSASVNSRRNRACVERLQTTVWLPAAVETYLPNDATLYEPKPDEDGQTR